MRSDGYSGTLADILRKRPMCEICHVRPATQLHHCIVHDMKRYHKELTVPENLMPVCEICHTSLAQSANSKKVREEFIDEQIKRGYNIGAWYRELPLKVKEYWILQKEQT